MTTWHIWHFWADYYEPVEVINETLAKVQFSDGHWSRKETKSHLIAPSVSALNDKRLNLAGKNWQECKRKLEEAQAEVERVSATPLKLKNAEGT